ncbi:NupC/NupG family nucleoside CNT transporter [Bacillaceae bacterium SIJ1]|uniref:NupC/NupG family nucleoside CNT transporter n=1 Tax=Litoribacterium kuwaitense TaxID=1398745 RepID=UPI0013EA95D1|nr:nucleoside transporter C-terminal domain-containing protein [Litoribacterium kuwaitense]NGP45773.1 NupC/NupG family nucleoside CNT transporter [Litoribacterium kuwaitense]
MNYFLLINIIGILVFIGVAYLFSKDKKNVHWKSVGILVVFNLFLAWLLTAFPGGRWFVGKVAEAFNWLIETAFSGVGFAFASMVNVENMDVVFSALMPILLVVPLFDILTYFGILPKIIKGLGWGLSKLTGQPKFESFYAIEMMFLGNTEALAVSGGQLRSMTPQRLFTISLMSMSCVSAAMIGVYTTMIPAEFVLTAVPLNVINAIIVTSILNPVVITKEEDVIFEIKKEDKPPFFSYLGDSILGAGKLILIITAMIIAFVSLAALIDKVLLLIAPWLTLSNILGVVMTPFALLLGLPIDEAFQTAQFMGTKLVTNEFVVMMQMMPILDTFSPHMLAVLSTFMVSFANFSTIGMILGCFNGIVDKEKAEFLSKGVWMMILSGTLVSLLSAGFVGLFVW